MKKEIKYVHFEKEDKIKIFDEIIKKFYYANFGQASKSDIELMMFNFYIEKLIDENKRNDGTINYNMCSDYLISKELGITQQRVRNLKVKKQLVYPVDFDWKTALGTLIKNARMDESTHKIIINIPDPNLYYEIQNFLEESGAYNEVQLNSKILQIRAEYFFALALDIEDEENKQKIIKTLKKQFEESSVNNQVFDEKNVGKTLLNIGIESLNVVSNLSSMLSPGNIIGNILKSLLK